MRKIVTALLLFALSLGVYAQNILIPQPQKIDYSKGVFKIPETIYLSSDLPMEENLYFMHRLNKHFKIELTTDKKATIRRSLQKKGFTKEGYAVDISSKNIEINFSTNEGYFRALQTLAQLFDEHREDRKIPNLTIQDEPQFKWRGMHLDVVRHFFTVEEVKKYLDYLALYKINTFHWHLTDDQGWRIEIKQYPKLTEIGSKRKESMIGPYSDDTYDGTPYGGFYTQDEIREVVEYAKKLHITVVPEIEMPGHALAALTAYPELSCTSGPFEVATKWGVFDDVFCPKDETFEFLENVLDEVTALFPSEYIHIGGDECPKTRWKECPHCQDLIKKENLGNEHGLQSYFIQTIEKYVNSKGRKIIGWNEILEGGLAPNAAVMSWTGEEGGIEAAKTGHYAVMTPGMYCYFDHYQGDPQNEPLAFGGYTTLEKIYSYHPIPKELSHEEGKYILGVQANLWTEYILDFKGIEYMLLPRLMALSEVGWGTNQPKNYLDFEKKAVYHFTFLDEMKVNYAKSIFNPSGKVIRSGKGVAYELYTSKDPKNIHYTIDGTLPTLKSPAYSQPIPVDKSMTIQSAYFEEGGIKSAITHQSLSLTKSTGKEIELVHQPSELYAFGGAMTLVDGIKGDAKVLGKTWLGFSGTDVLATLDLGEKTSFSEIRFNSLNNTGSWIHIAKGAKISISEDGKNYKIIKEIGADEIRKTKGQVVLLLDNQNAQYLKVEIFNAGIIPPGNPGAGHEAWLFVDEIGVY